MSAPSDGARADARKRLVESIGRLEGRGNVVVEAAKRTAHEIGKTIAASSPVEAEIKVQIAASWLVFAHLIEQESRR